ncbi:hypothetical protein PMAYCL1PPCAC_03639, partial [Pristionchus mayeri]
CMAKPEVRIEIDPFDDGEREWMEEVETRRRKKSKRRISIDQPSMTTAPAHVHTSEWKDMIGMADLLGEHSTIPYDSKAFDRLRDRSTSKAQWIEQTLLKRECCQFIPSQKYLSKCGCGRTLEHHSKEAIQSLGRIDEESDSSLPRVRWSIKKHTVATPTDAFGTIQFENVGVYSQANYARLSFDTDPSTVLRLMQAAWKTKPPKLIITIHGGLTNFDLQPKLVRALRRGIMKTAKSCDTWIITTGMHQGAVQHVGDALTDLRSSRKNKSKVAAIGIAPWGLIKKRERLVGHNNHARCTMNVFTNGRFLELDNAHSHFLLADNGTVGRYGAEVILRRRLESFLSTGSAPVVAVVVEGGCFAVKVVHDYVTSHPSIPVVVCDGSGRASDLLAFTHKYVEEEGCLPDSMRSQLLSLIKGTFDMDEAEAGRVLRQIVESAEKKELLNIFRLGEGMNDVDHSIFTALIKGTNMDQLKLALAWNRVDIARSHIFGGNLIWSQQEMQEALMYVLLHNRVDFVHLILENGVGMQNFLTFERLEQLYNTDVGPAHTLYSLTKKEEFTIPEIGAVMEKLIGRSFRSSYTSDDFLYRYNVWQSRAHFKAMSAKRIASKSGHNSENMSTNGGVVKRKKNTVDDEEEEEETTTENMFAFERPFNELLIWAVLTKRQDMAMIMWQHGEEPLAKAVIANRLYSSLAENASDEFIELTLCDELRRNAETFQKLACEFLEACYQVDDEQTASLLTEDLTNWGSLTALSIASNNHDRLFMKHPSCQNILNVIWHGGMVVQHSADLMILASIFCPPLLFSLDFKSKEELEMAPQTTAEFEENVESDTDSTDSSDDSFTDSDTSSSEEEKPARKNSRSSSINFSNFLSSARRSFRKESEKKEQPTIQQLAAHTLPGMFTSAVVPPSASSSDEVRTRAGTVQQKSRSRKESSSGARGKISRSSTHKSGTRKGTDTCSDMFECIEDEKAPEPKKKTPLSWTRKITEFYQAPITTFYLWELSFAVFQIVLAYVILTRTDEERIHWVEYYLIAYVVVFGCDLIRKFLYYDVRSFSLKMYKFCVSFRNGSSVLAVITYIIAFGFRCFPGWAQTGRVMIIMNSVFWSLKFVEYLSVYRFIGPYIKMSADMIPSCIPQLTLLFLILLSYGTVRQSITYPYEDWNIILIRNIFLKPYYMLYGEVYAAQIDTCNDGMWDYHLDEGITMYDINQTVIDEHSTDWNCVPGHWVSPFYMTFFMLISFVLLMNSMIASCTWVYEHRVMYTKEIWLLERFRVVMDFESKPFLPPPLSIIVHFYHLCKYLIWKCRCGKKKGERFYDNTLKSFLTPDQLHALRRFENQVLEDLERKKEFDKKHSDQEHVKQTTIKTETIFNQLNSMSTVKETARDLIRELEQRMTKLETDRKEHVEMLASIAAQLERLTSSRASSMAPPSYDNQPSSFPRVFLASEDSIDAGEEIDFGRWDEPAVAKNPIRSTKIRHNSEYTTIADAIERPTSQRPLFTRRRRVTSSGEANSNLFSVSEMDEIQPTDHGETEDEKF